MNSASTPPPAPASNPARALLGWRLLALVYDFFPALALWMLLSALFNFGYYLAGHDARDILKTASLLGVLLWLCCWAVTGAYATISWRRGGATLGMRPWRLRVVSAEGGAASFPALWKRYAVGTLSLLLAGAGFWWALFDRERLTWHDRASGTRMLRGSKNP